MGEIHCPSCGGTGVKLTNSVGRLVGEVGGSVVSHRCTSCNLNFTSVITGGEMFPDRKSSSVSKDLEILFRRSA